MKSSFLAPLRGLLGIAVIASALVAVSSPQAFAAPCGSGGPYGGGTGVAGNPYLLSDASHVDYLRSNAGTDGGCEFEQVANISMGNTTWSASGISSFSGNYDGGGYVISNLSISVSRSDLGLFENVTGTITDLGFTGDVNNVGSSSRAFTGGLVGVLDGGTIANSYTTGSVQSAFTNTASNTATGGLVGRISGGGVVQQSYATGSVSAINNAGGLVGATAQTVPKATISESYATGSVTVTTSGGGGLVAVAFYVDIERSFATGDVEATNAPTGAQHFAGFVGAIDGAVGENVTITDSYSTGSITVSPNGVEIGGFVGDAGSLENVTFTRTYSATTNGVVATGAGVNSAGGYGGVETEVTMAKSFWNSETTFQFTNDWGDLADDSDIKAKNTASLKDLATYTDDTAGFDWNSGGATTIADGWDPSYTWGICSAVNDGYPFLTAFYTVDPCGSTPPTPPAPPVTFPPGPPLNVTATPGDAQAVITWSPPTSAGSFPITNYEIKVSPGGHTCLVQAPTLTCTITGLTNGTPYTAVVRALNGAGWGTFSTPSASFTPQAPPIPSIVITGNRAEIKGRPGVIANGITTNLVGQTVQARVHLSGEIDYYNGSRRVIDANGEFTWQRKSNGKVYVYFRTLNEQVRSNRIIIPR